MCMAPINGISANPPAAWHCFVGFLAYSRRFRVFALLLLLALLAGCAAPNPQASAGGRRFDFRKDTFAYANDLVWEYGYETNGNWTSHRRAPASDYTLRCFVVARSAAQFFEHARFDPAQPVADQATYRQLIRQVVTSSPRKNSDSASTIIIPGYPNLRGFSSAQETLLKAECGGFLQSYFQRGNWRMIFPFSRDHQASTLRELLDQIAKNRVAVVHLVRFPQLSINHAVVVYDAKLADRDAFLSAYDPNDPEKPVSIVYDGVTRTFMLPPTGYFPGGRVDIYQVYHRWNY
jgi:hypothetical protein